MTAAGALDPAAAGSTAAPRVLYDNAIAQQTGMDVARDLRAEFRKIVNIVSWECLEDHGFEAPFSIHVTDSSGYVFSAAFVEDAEPGRARLLGIKAPKDENGEIAEHTLVFPLSVFASDHEGRSHRSNFLPIQ